MTTARAILICLCFLIALPFSSLAEVLVVVNKNISGPGSFADALARAAANGSIDKDYVHFNLPGTTLADHTIFVDQVLPELSSNLVIDGTTQPGDFAGVSNAKIRLISGFPEALRSVLRINHQTDIELYGLLFERAAGLTREDDALICTAGKNIMIGAPGKGNVFKITLFIENVIGRPFDLPDHSENVKISSNFFGLNEDGESPAATACEFTARAVKNLTVGGETPAHGNVIFGEFLYADQFTTTLPMGNLVFRYNRCSVNAAGTRLVINPNRLQSIICWGNYVENMVIQDNQVAGASYLYLKDVKCRPAITANKFGTDVTGTIPLGLDGRAIQLDYCLAGGTIGGPTDADANIFSGANRVVVNPATVTATVVNMGSPGFELARNVFRCNDSNIPYSITVTNPDMPVVRVNVAARDASSISGTATPGSRVDLYYSLGCKFCEPEKYFTSVTADNAGKWMYNGTLGINNVIVSATLNGQTSEFSTIHFTHRAADVKITHVCDNVQGSISGLQFIGALNYGWYRETGELVSKTVDLTGAGPGKYKFMIDDNYCPVVSDVFEIKDFSIVTDLTGMQITPASCTRADGGITGIQVTGVTYRWTDSRNVLRSTIPQLQHAEGGQYTLTLSNGICTKQLGPFTVPIVNSLLINEASATVKADVCGKSEGAITGITAAGGFGTYRYRWTDDAGKEVATTLVLTSVKSGTYILYVSDESGCASSSKPFFVANAEPVISPPVVASVNLCAPGMAVLQASHPVEGGYRLYGDSFNSLFLTENATGRFEVEILRSQKFYISAVNGNCESARTEVSVSITGDGLAVSNTISPNHDGINDVWVLNMIDNYPDCRVRIYNRNGDTVFESRGYGTPFDGTRQGKELPDGVYYYLIELRVGCNAVRGSLLVKR